MIILLDAGHGGVIAGNYQTAGRRSPVWKDGSQLFEGEFNRWIVNGISERLSMRRIPYVLISPEQRDVGLKTRVNRANIYAKKPSLYVSIHANAGGGSGFEVYTSKGTTKSDYISNFFAEEFMKTFPERRLRADLGDGDLDKDRNFYVLKNTKIPAVLTENFFMDNEDECRNIMLTTAGREKIVDFHVKAIVRLLDEN
ncbi:MAG: N-acetylmuramoyl-L-alanine amidase [Methylophilaceae bacterium]